MREIKFRAWDKTRNKMLYNILPWTWDFVIHTGYWKCLKSHNDSGIAEMRVDMHQADGNNVMQFTGLLDKNGKEIYEGDIVTHKYQKFAVVEWNDEHACFHTLTIDEIVKDEIMFCLNDIIEVIGNIYENSELLKEVSK